MKETALFNIDELESGSLTHEELETQLPMVKAPSRSDPNFLHIDGSPRAIGEKSRLLKAAFLGSKSPEEIRMAASALPLMDWLDFAVRLMPKEVQMKGQFEVRSLVAQMGPLRNERDERD